MLHRGWFPDSITGERIVLRRHVPDNLGAFRRWYTDPEVARLTRYQEGPMPTVEIDRFFHARVVGTDSLALAIHLRDSGRLIGTCAFSQLDADNGSAMFHITIGEKDAWGLGLGSEATALMLEHAFERLGLHRVALSVFSFNERAIRAYRKAGFVVEGRSRQSIWRDGRYWDELQMSMLDSDWTSRAKPTPGSTIRDAPSVEGEELPVARIERRA
ncbi:MAG: hypothetical protein QOF11_886 [Chloroflexota bacterium]|jgi:RimJ/RimL family protein N-acetyltransferase|nr:hypothetical protein [Chloroflexota bacterium]